MHHKRARAHVEVLNENPVLELFDITDIMSFACCIQHIFVGFPQNIRARNRVRIQNVVMIKKLEFFVMGS